MYVFVVFTFHFPFPFCSVARLPVCSSLLFRFWDSSIFSANLLTVAVDCASSFGGSPPNPHVTNPYGRIFRIFGWYQPEGIKRISGVPDHFSGTARDFPSGIRFWIANANMRALITCSHHMLPKPTCRRTTRTNITIKLWVSQFAMLFWGSRLHRFVSHRCFERISVRISARIFCTDFCADFLHGFSAQIFLHGFLPAFFARISARIVCKNCLYRCCTDFCTDFLGCPKTPAGKRQNFTEKIPQKIHNAVGAFWGGAREAGG